MAYLHVNGHRLRANRTRPPETREPVFTAKPSRSQSGPYANRIGILDHQGNEVATLVYDPEHPLSCGATAWVETKFPPILGEVP